VKEHESLSLSLEVDFTETMKLKYQTGHRSHQNLSSNQVIQQLRLGSLSTDPPGQLDVLGHDGDTLGVDSAQVSVLE